MTEIKFLRIYLVVATILFGVTWWAHSSDIEAARVRLEELTKQVDNLHRQNVVWQQMVDKIPGGVMKISGETGYVIYCNAAITTNYGYRMSDFARGPLVDVGMLPDEYRRTHLSLITDPEFHAARVGHSPITVTGDVFHRDGTASKRNIAIQAYYDEDNRRKWNVFTSPSPVLTEAEHENSLGSDRSDRD